VKEVWNEIKEGMGVKTFFIALLSIATLLFLALMLVFSLKGESVQRMNHLVDPLTQSTQTNFTQ
jgi:uncharacterized BrkB/YihY/UPF0761 family membrane protein